jgi:hypothetical protein
MSNRVVAAPVDRLTLQQLVRATPSSIVARATRQCHLIRRQYALGSLDGFRRQYGKNRTSYNEMRTWTTCTDGKRNSYLRFFGAPALDTPVWAWCDCQYFCVAGPTIISTPDGLRPIEETLGPVRTFTRTGVQQGETFPTGVAKTLLLTTTDGFSIRATPNERFTVLTPDLQQAWRTLAELQPGDFVALKPGAAWPTETVPFSWQFQESARGAYKRKIAGKLKNVRGNTVSVRKLTTPTHMTPELARVLGYLVAEGNGDRNTIEFTQNTGPALDDFVECWKAAFPDSHLSFTHAATETGMQVSCRSVYLAAFFKEALGYNPTLKCHEKSVPNSILCSPREHVVEFLRAYFEGDGTCSKRQVSCTTTSETLAKDLQRLLLSLGIRFGKSDLSPPTDNCKPPYCLITGGHGAVRFMEQIGFVTKNKQLDFAVGKHGRHFPHVRRVIRNCIRPNGYYELAGKKHRLSLWKHSVLSQYGYGTKDGLTEYSLRRYLDDPCGKNLQRVYPVLYERMNELLHDDVEWAEVASIDQPKKVPTFDATVPKGHQFVANGFVVHNTFYLEVVLSRYNCSTIRNSNGMLPVVRNKRMIPHLCKHLLIAAKYAVQEKRDLVQEELDKQTAEQEALAGKKAAGFGLRAGRGQVIPKGRFTRPSGRDTGLVDL